MKICLTGSTGFVGSKLCAHLLENSHEIFAPVRNLNLVSLPMNKNLKLVINNTNKRKEVFFNKILQYPPFDAFVQRVASDPISL